jgi:hypothetical protein
LPTPDRHAEAASEALRWLTIEHLRTIRDETRPTTQRPKDQAQRRWIMTRATPIVIAAITAITVVRADPLPVPFTGGNCPFGYYWTGSYCLPAGVPGAAAKAFDDFAGEPK